MELDIDETLSSNTDLEDQIEKLDMKIFELEDERDELIKDVSHLESEIKKTKEKKEKDILSERLNNAEYWLERAQAQYDSRYDKKDEIEEAEGDIVAIKRVMELL